MTALKKKPLVRATAVLFALAGTAFGQQSVTLDSIPDPSPQFQMESFQLAEGFEVNLFASDPTIAKPIQMNWDAEGRLWLVSSRLYPHIKPGQRSDDQIIVLEDADGDGVAEKSTVFAEDLLIPTGLLPADGGVYVANSTELLFLKDTTGDGKADHREVMLSGFGTEDTHHLLHTLRGGPDGMIYMNQSIYIHSHVETPWGPRRLMGGGIWHFRPQTRELEVFSEGMVNPWGHVFDRWGQSFATDGAYGEGVNYVFPGAVYATAPGAKRIVKGMSPGQPKHCSLEILNGRHLPDDWQGVMVANDFRGHRVNAFRISEAGSGYAARQVEDLIKTTHSAFRPIDVRMGPDGAVYIADWYNPIIQHGEVDFRDPRRDHVHGRIWRVTAKGRPLVERPQIVGVGVEDLLGLLRSPEDMTRYFAKRELAGRPDEEVLPALEKWAANPGLTTHEQLEALWTSQGRNVLNDALLRKLLAAPEHQARAAAVRVLYHWHSRVADHMELLAKAVGDEHPQVRLEAVNALRKVGSAEAVEIALRVVTKPMDVSLDFAAWRTAKDLQSVWLPAFEKSEIGFDGDPAQLAFALRSAENVDALEPLLKALENAGAIGDDQRKVIALVGELGGGKELGRLFVMLGGDAAGKLPIFKALESAVRERKVVPAGQLDSVAKWFGDPDPEVAQLSVRAAGMWRLQSLRGRLGLLTSGGDLDLRRAAIDALASLGGRESAEFLGAYALKKDMPFTLRARAASRLLSVDGGLAATRSVELLTAATPGLAGDTTDIFDAFLGLKNGPKSLAQALGGKRVVPEVALLGVQRASASAGDTKPLIEALTKAGRLDPISQVLDEKAMAEMMVEVAEKGDAARGEAIYARSNLLCTVCHAIGAAGGAIGPDLVSVGASAPVDYIIESLLDPSKKIKEGYHTTQVTKKDGTVLTGGLLRDGGGVVVLRDAAGKEINVPADQIVSRSVSPVSLMPPALTASLRRDEFIDLVSFLSELGKEGEYKVPRERYVRRWRVADANGVVGGL
ncbi:MAG: putative heme-binding domain-containing protein, partial [Pseudoalteromonas tetraodonis]